MGIFDWIGPLNAGRKRRGWDALPLPTERKSSWIIDDRRAVIVSPLVHGPGASEGLTGWRRGDANSAVFACLQVLATSVAEPELKLYRVSAGERVEVDDAPVTELLKRPNPHMTTDQLLAYLSHCLHVDGNAFWRKLRAGDGITGNVVELWPISPTRIEVRTEAGSEDFITAYRYHKAPGKFDDIPPENMIHFRVGLEDGDHRLGCSSLKRLLREVSSDDQATRYADRLLANFATPGLSVEFPPDAQGISQDEAEAIKLKLQAAYGGDNLGAISVMSPGSKLVTHGFSPEQMDMKTLHRVPEERIAAVLGVPAIVAGLGAGLDRSTYSNFSEAREAFTEMKLIPFWRSISATLTLQLLPDFVSDRNAVLDFDIDDVRALGDDEDKKQVRLAGYVAAGILDVNEARAEIGREPKAEPEPQPAPVPLRVVDADEMPQQMRASRRRLAIKAPDDLLAGFGRLREAAGPAWEAELTTFLARQLRRVNAALRAGADTAEALVAEGEAALLGETLTPLQLRLFEEVHGLVIAELGIDFQLDDPTTREYLRRAGANIVGITDTTRDAVRTALLEGQYAGEGIDQLAARLRDLPAFGEARARVVARTELGHAQNTAAVANYRASGVVVGIRVLDGDYDSACQAMNGRTFALGHEPATLQHPNCLVGESMVMAADVHATFARWFDGEVVVIRTASDDLLTCTPNHPILTGRGWVAAGVLREGDYVVRCTDRERMGRWLDPYDYKMPARIEQIVGSMWPAGAGYAAAVPCTAEDFHGDAVDGEVCVVRADRLRKGDVLRLMTQHRGKLLVEGRYPEMASLPGLRSLAELLMATAQTAHGSVSSLSLPEPFVWADPRHLGTGNLSAGTQGVTTVLEPPPNARPVDADRGADLIGALAGLVAPIQVVSVNRRQFAGHVYNLETRDGWYVADGIITHNCVRAFAPITDAAELDRTA